MILNSVQAVVASLVVSNTCLIAAANVADSTPPIPPQAPMTEGVADLGNIKLWYWDTGGTGEVIVLLHPGSGSSEFYTYQQPVLVHAGYRVISYSRRGQFKSGLGSDFDSYFAADDLLKLLKFLQVGKCHLVGNALGGYVALDFAISHPDRVRSLVLACSMMGISEPDFARALNTNRPRSFDSWSIEERELGPTYRASSPSGAAEWKTRHERSGKSAFTRLRNKITWQTLERLPTPTLLITGDEDPYLAPAALQLVREKIPHSKIAVIHHASHAVQWEQPEAFNREVLDFIRSVRGN